jgi:hypothetical protein
MLWNDIPSHRERCGRIPVRPVILGLIPRTQVSGGLTFLDERIPVMTGTSPAITLELRRVVLSGGPGFIPRIEMAGTRPAITL